MVDAVLDALVVLAIFVAVVFAAGYVVVAGEVLAPFVLAGCFLVFVNVLVLLKFLGDPCVS